MNLFQAFRMSIKAIMGKKARSFLTMLGIIIGVAAVIVLVSLTQASNDKNMEWMRSFGTNIVNVYLDPWRNPRVSQELEDYIAVEIAGLTRGMTPNSSMWGSRVSYGAKAMEELQLYFGSADFSICNNYKIAKGRDLSYMDIQRNTRAVVLGAKVADEIFNYMNPIGEQIRINGEIFTVVGIYQARVTDPNMWDGYDKMVVVPYTQTRLLNRNNRISEYAIKAKDAESTQEVVTLLQKFLSTKYDDEWSYGVYTSDTWMSQIDEANRSNLIMLGSIAGISLIVGGIGIMNIMLVTVTERTREIGIRKAIGAQRRTIIAQFLIEASVLSLIGGFVGLIFGFLITVFWGKMTYDMLVLPNMMITLIALVVSIGLGVGFGLYPAVKASALQPVVALRNE
ncbi:MAG: ABC transporter permease [Oscillospiraceae bacterium]|nr:ABC transporter permease [Oscillospiraceae bacterium]